MKNYFSIIVLFYLIMPLSGIAQNIEGKAYYISKTEVNSNFAGRQLSEAQKARIKERQDKASLKEYVLEFNNEKSLYKANANSNEATQQSTGRGGGVRMLLNSQNDGIYFKNTITKEYVAERDIYGKKFLVSDTLKTYKWHLTGDVKTIGRHLCFKATTAIPKIDVPSDSPENTTTITVWYTIEIPVSHGPEMFWGLPGLILELNTENRTILCSKIELRNDEDLVIIPPKKGKKVSQDKFDETFRKKAKEVKEMMDNRRARGGRKN